MRNKRTSSPAGKSIWDLTPLFRDDDDPRIDVELERVKRETARFMRKWKDRGDFLQRPMVLREALDDYERWSRRCGTDGAAGYYFWLRTQQDQNDPLIKAKYNRMEEFGRKVGNEMQFFHLRLAKIPPRRQSLFLEHKSLEKYRHYLRRLFAESSHLLSEPEERILNLKAATSHGNWVRMTSGFLAKEERVVSLGGARKENKTFAELNTLMNSSDRRVRDSAARAFNDILARHAEVAEAEINSVLQDKKTEDELRGYARADQARHVADDVDSEVVDELMTAVSERFDIPARYYRLKARLMGVSRLKYHERNVEYGRIDREYPYAESCGMIERVMAGLDDTFAEIFRRFVRQRQIDVFPRKGKSGGAFCVHHLPGHPTYILLNHTNRLNDVLTLAHEVGHGINNELIKRRQHALYFGITVFTGEVASTFMEDFVLQEILKRSDEETRLALMMMKLNEEISTIFRQVACYRFERELHDSFRQKGYLSKDEIGGLFKKHMAAYMGDAVEQSKGSENWWVYWSHIRAFFYVYSYASGLLISKSLQNAVKQDRTFIKKIKEFLSAGLSDSPERIFERVGITIKEREFWDNGLAEIESLLRETEELARKLDKIE